MSSQQEEIKARDEQAGSFEQWYGRRGVLYNYVEKKVIIDALNLQKDDILARIKELEPVQYARCKNIKEYLLKISVINILIARIILLFDVYPGVCLLARKESGVYE